MRVAEAVPGPEHLGRLQASTLDFTLVDAGANLGFTGGCNLGVAKSSRRDRVVLDKAAA